ncbi:MAG: hypothetical protein NTW50_03290, partial [Candidatus Berkelbacteria bacterium]|nr:hypothetical protein [Candidatus Berkelbacteria bacterium]
MALNHTFLLLSFIFGLGVGSYVLFRHKRNLSFVYLGLALLSVSFWPLTILLTLITANISIANLAFGETMLVFLLLVLFAANSSKSLSKLATVLLSIPALVVAVISSIPGFVTAKIAVENESVKLVENGSLFWLFYIFIAIYLILFVYFLYHSFRIATGNKKRQLLYISLGLIFSLIAGVVCNLILPAIGIFQFNSMGPVFIISSAAFTVYAATGHYQYEPRVVLAELYALLLIFVSIARLVMYPLPSSYILSGLTVGLCALFVRATLAEARRNLELKKDKRELLRLDKMKDEFLMVATHELNTPVTVLEGKVGMIANEGFGNFSAEQREYLKPVFENAQKLSHLFKHIVEVVRIDENRFKLEKTPVDLK